MTFNSLAFVGFFTVVYLAYRLLGVRHVWQNRLLLLASYLFYGVWDWRFPCLMGMTTAVDYGLAHLMRVRGDSKRLWLALSLVNNIGVLFVLKYFDFFQSNVTAMLRLLGLEVQPFMLGIFLPVGISFYTFQRLTFMIDVYREGEYRDITFRDFALFVSFFPLLLSGPIERARQLIPQIVQPRSVTWLQIETGIWLIAWGLFKKMFIADNLASLVNPVFSEGWRGSGSEALIATYAYAFQIYCDFSGYSDVAKGIALLLGFEVRWNFNLPYFATNPSDFWRRWHISLSTWLRDYVFIPLGGSREGEWKTYRNLMVTMVLVGLWHGAAWNFVIWGLYHGTLLALYRMFGGGESQGRRDSTIMTALKMFAMFHLTCFGWLLFRASSVEQVAEVLRALTMRFSLPAVDPSLLWQLAGYLVLLLAVQTFQSRRGSLFVLDRAPVAVKGVAYGLLFYLTILHGGTSDSFIYFQF